MRSRLLLAGLLAAASLAVPASADPLAFERECKGTYDTACYHDFCGIVDCIRTDCLVYSEVTGGGNAALCLGRTRPRDPISS